MLVHEVEQRAPLEPQHQLCLVVTALREPGQHVMALLKYQVQHRVAKHLPDGRAASAEAFPDPLEELHLLSVVCEEPEGAVTSAPLVEDVQQLVVHVWEVWVGPDVEEVQHFALGRFITGEDFVQNLADGEMGQRGRQYDLEAILQAHVSQCDLKLEGDVFRRALARSGIFQDNAAALFGISWGVVLALQVRAHFIRHGRVRGCLTHQVERRNGFRRR